VRSDKTRDLVALASVVNIQETGAASELRLQPAAFHHGVANLAPGIPWARRHAWSRPCQQARTPIQVDYDGESRELKRSSGGLLLTFGFALLSCTWCWPRSSRVSCIRW
jgi:hypothetical protein